MSTLSKSWATAAELAVTDAYGGAVADVAADQKYDYTNDVDLETSGYEGAQVLIEYRGSGATDKLIVAVFASLDGSIYDTEPFLKWELENDSSPKAVTKIIKDLAHFRLGLKSSGTADTFDYRVTYQAWNTDDS